MEDESSSDNEDIDDGGELQINGEYEISGLTVMSDDLPGDMEMEVSGLEEPEDMETAGVRGIKELVQVHVEVEKEVDMREERKVKDFLQAGYGCSDSCWKKFEPSYLRATKTSLLELSSH
uniref:Uncharacterized protein n=1 Tax=Amphimedon queenslandica TaxID=400682 RepID=A0A1X7UYZ9_AMPQE